MTDYKADAKASRREKLKHYADGGRTDSFPDFVPHKTTRKDGVIREIDPGEDWGGLDRNNWRPDDVMAPKPMQEDT